MPDAGGCCIALSSSAGRQDECPGAVLAWTLVVDRARDELFAGAGFALDQNGRIGRSGHAPHSSLTPAALGDNDRFFACLRRYRSR